MKVHNVMRKISMEQTNLSNMRESVHARIDSLNELMMPHSKFNKEILNYATVKMIDDMRRKVEKCAVATTMMPHFTRLDKLNENFTRRLNQDFITKDSLNGKLRDLDETLMGRYMQKTAHKELKEKYDSRFEFLEDI